MQGEYQVGHLLSDPMEVVYMLFLSVVESICSQPEMEEFNVVGQ